MTSKSDCAFLLALGLSLLLSGCASDPTLSTPDPGATPQVAQAREVLNQQLDRAPFIKDVVFLTGADEFPMINYTDPETGNGQSVALSDLLPASIATSYSP